MKPINKILIAVAVIVFLLAMANPDQNDFQNWVDDRIAAKTDQEEGIRWAVAKVVGVAGSEIIRRNTRRKNYLIFSIYEVRVMNTSIRAVGFLGNFWLIE